MFYVLSDIHGCYNELQKALSYWHPETETLVVLGDNIDRGPDSLQVVQELMHLQATYGEQVVVLQGNHDESFAKWLLDTHPSDFGFYYMETYNETLLSFFDHDREKYKNSTRKQRGQHALYKYAKEVRYLYDLPKYYETEHCLFVHAGINLTLQNGWRSDTQCMNSIGSAFIYAKTKAPKKVFFGHTPTSLIRNEPTNHAVWQSEMGDKVGIDGGVSMGGQLNALKLDPYGNILETFTIKHDRP